MMIREDVYCCCTFKMLSIRGSKALSHMSKKKPQNFRKNSDGSDGAQDLLGGQMHWSNFNNNVMSVWMCRRKHNMK